MKTILRVFDVLWKIVETVAAVVLAAVTAVAFYQIVSRYIFQSSNAGIDELTRLAFVWCASLGSAMAFRRGSHLGVTAIIGKFKGKGKIIVSVFIQLAIIFFMVIVMFAGFHLVERGMKQFSEYLRLNMAIFYGCIPCGAIFSILAGIENILKLLVPEKNGKEAEA